MGSFRVGTPQEGAGGGLRGLMGGANRDSGASVSVLLRPRSSRAGSRSLTHQPGRAGPVGNGGWSFPTTLYVVDEGAR
jgi:hypothetical protein